MDPLTIRRLLYGDAEDVHLILTGSGKAALALVLRYFRDIGRLPDKNTPVLVPRWLGAWVYNVMYKTCFPELEARPGTAGIMIYHQYGYPQNMVSLMDAARRNGWFVIEDCAHAIRSVAGGQRMGLVGDAAILSFSKFFPSLTGGAVVTRDAKMAESIAAAAARSGNSWAAVCFWTRFLSERGRLAPAAVEATYGIYDSSCRIASPAGSAVLRALGEGSLDRRDAIRDLNIRDLEDLGCLAPTYEDERITPYVLPVLGPTERLHRLAVGLAGVGVRTGVYQFDVRRNQIDPKFEPCVWLPVHPGVSERLRQGIVAQVRMSMA